jgi:hypothetical protein
MEYKDHSHNQLDEGLIRSIGKGAMAAGKTVGRGAMTAGKKVGSATMTAGKKVGSATMTAGKMGGGLAASIGRGAAKEYSPDNLAKKAVQALGGQDVATGRMDQGPPAKGYLGIPKKMMQALPTDDAGRFTVAKKVGGAISRGIGGRSPGSMKGVFDNDAFSAGPSDSPAYSDQKNMRRQARELMQLDPTLTYGQAIGMVMQQISQQDRQPQQPKAKPTPAPKGTPTTGGAGSHAPSTEEPRKPRILGSDGEPI